MTIWIFKTRSINVVVWLVGLLCRPLNQDSHVLPSRELYTLCIIYKTMQRVHKAVIKLVGYY
jgi:hypothetical protein